MNLLRISNAKALGILEQAAFIDELKNTRHLSLADIAEQLSRSKSWVSMRVGLIAQMSVTVRAKLFSGATGVAQSRRLAAFSALDFMLPDSPIFASVYQSFSRRILSEPVRGCIADTRPRGQHFCG